MIFEGLCGWQCATVSVELQDGWLVAGLVTRRVEIGDEAQQAVDLLDGYPYHATIQSTAHSNVSTIVIVLKPHSPPHLQRPLLNTLIQPTRLWLI